MTEITILKMSKTRQCNSNNVLGLKYINIYYLYIYCMSVGFEVGFVFCLTDFIYVHIFSYSVSTSNYYIIPCVKYKSCCLNCMLPSSGGF